MVGGGNSGGDGGGDGGGGGGVGFLPRVLGFWVNVLQLTPRLRFFFCLFVVVVVVLGGCYFSGD